MSRILLIEDEPWMGDLYSTLLSKNHEVTWLRDAYDAIESIDAHRPDAIMLDLMLPYANGVQLLHELATYRDTADIPVVLFSAALPEELDAATLESYGVMAMIDKATTKPAAVLEIVEKVARVHADI